MHRRSLFKLLAAASVSFKSSSPARAFGKPDPPPARQKMVLIGAGSAMFTQGLIIDWIQQRPPGDWEIALVDINHVILEATDKMVRRYMETCDHPAKITSTVWREDVLPGATIVISTIGVGSRRAWEQDVLVPRKFGIYQPVGDTVMPGGVSRAMRMIPPMLDIARDVERFCPEAWFINYANPMTAVVRAIRRETSATAIGLCAGVEETIQYLARITGISRSKISARWAGINHLTWIYELQSEGRSLWPEIRKRVAALRANGIDRGSWANPFGSPSNPEMLNHPFTWELFEEFGGFPSAMDRHTSEFFPERFPGGEYFGSTLGVDAYSFEGTIAAGDRIYDETLALAELDGPIPQEHLESTGGEHMQTMEVFHNFWEDRRNFYSVNLPNQGCVSNLPDESILEVPALATSRGMIAPPIGEIPVSMASVLMRQLAAVEATVEAAVTGNRKLFTEALILDGGVTDYAKAVELTDALIAAQEVHLPQFV